jgi:hypothetical protein
MSKGFHSVKGLSLYLPETSGNKDSVLEKTFQIIFTSWCTTCIQTINGILDVGATGASKSVQYLLGFELSWGHLLVALQFTIPLVHKKYTRR